MRGGDFRKKEKKQYTHPVLPTRIASDRRFRSTHAFDVCVRVSVCLGVCVSLPSCIYLHNSRAVRATLNKHDKIMIGGDRERVHGTRARSPNYTDTTVRCKCRFFFLFQFFFSLSLVAFSPRRRRFARSGPQQDVPRVFIIGTSVPRFRSVHAGENPKDRTDFRSEIPETVSQTRIPPYARA